MKNAIKTWAVCLSALMLLGVFAGCGKTEDTPEGLVILEEALAPEEYGIGFRKGDALCEQVNAALKVLKANGTAADIATKWFGSDITTIVADENALDGVAVEEGRTLILGLDDAFPPMGYRDGNNNIVGFDIDLAQAVCSYLGWELTLQPISWDAKEMELNSGNIDCIWNGMSLDEDRMAAMSCTEPYLANEQVLVVRADSGYSTLSDLSGKTIALQKESTAASALDAAESFKKSLANVSTFGNNLECLMDLEQGGVDAVLMDSVVASYYITTGSSDIS